MLNIELLPRAIYEIFSTVANTNILTVSHYHGLLAVALENNLEEEERHTVNRILRAVQRGKITLVA